MSANQEDQQAKARQKAQKHFTSSEQRDANLRQELENKLALFDAKSARLRALRLEKEAADKAAMASQKIRPTSEKVADPRTKRITM